MTTYMLALTGDEAKAAHWAGVREARLLSVSRPPHGSALIDVTPPAADRAPVARDPAALAALLLRTLDLQDGAGVVLADFDSEEFAADVVARITALGRRVTRPGRFTRFGLGAIARSRFARP